MSDFAIEVENLSICYKGLKSYSIKKNLFRGQKSKVEIFEAVKDMSFRLEKGAILGLVGKNGSGKSTLLKAIAGIFTPDSGFVDLHGNSVSLLAIGVGFQRELSGRENILLSGETGTGKFLTSLKRCIKTFSSMTNGLWMRSINPTWQWFVRNLTTI
jgi:ABC-type polysaccharide/polyol phosphate transport system ATPase subunit